MKKVLITGLTGIVGSGLYSYLLNDSNFDIVALCRKNSDVSYIKSRCTIEFGSMKDDKFIEEICNKYNFDMLIHIAYKGEIVRFAKISKKFNIKEVILVSSTYSLSKKYPNNRQLQLENEASKILDSYNCKYSMILPTSIFGARPNGTKDYNMSTFIKYVKKGLFPLFAKGTATVRPIWGKDVGKAIYIAMNNIDAINKKRIVVSGDKERSFKQMITSVGNTFHKKVYFIYIPGWVSKFIFYSLYYITFKRIDYREKINRLLENRAFDTSQEIIDLGFIPHSLEECLIRYDVSK